MNFCRWMLKRIKLFILFWTRIVFVKNNFKVSFFNKLRMNFGGGYLADQYVLYDLKNNDKREYLSEFDWYKSRYINEPFNFAFNNKIVCAELLEKYLYTPENYYIKSKDVLYKYDGNVADINEIYSFIKTIKKCIIKPIAMGKGKGVHFIEEKDGKVVVDDKIRDKEYLTRLLHESDNYFICEYMEQHKYANDLFNKTVNTIRIITFRDPGTHEMKIFFAVQRIGTQKTIPVDNASKGGLVSKIDLETGMLSEARCLHELNTYTVHPESGAKIKGVIIPNWDEVKKQVLDISKSLPYMEMIAWDLLITERGLSVIEANTSSGINIIQLWGGQRRSEFADFLRYHRVLKN